MREAESVAEGTRPTTAGELIALAIAAYRALALLGETVTDEWQYVTDLVTVHSADLGALSAPDPSRAVAPANAAAIQLAIDEIALITDPHRAIDWLSTFPQIVRLALVPATPAA